MDNVEMDFTCWVQIKVVTRLGGDLIERLFWEGLPFHTRCKFDWYFKYRAALLQVKYPKYYVDYAWGNQKKQDYARIRLSNLIKAKRRSITLQKSKIEHYTNAIQQAKNQWSMLFDIESDPSYIIAVSQLKNLEQKLSELQDELLTLIESEYENQAQSH